MNWISVKNKDKFPTAIDILSFPKREGYISHIPVLVTDGEDVTNGYFGLVLDITKKELVESVKIFACHEFESEAIKYWMPLPKLPEVED